MSLGLSFLTHDIRFWAGLCVTVVKAAAQLGRWLLMSFHFDSLPRSPELLTCHTVQPKSFLGHLSLRNHVPGFLFSQQQVTGQISLPIWPIAWAGSPEQGLSETVAELPDGRQRALLGGWRIFGSSLKESRMGGHRKRGNTAKYTLLIYAEAQQSDKQIACKKQPARFLTYYKKNNWASKTLQSVPSENSRLWPALISRFQGVEHMSHPSSKQDFLNQS